MVNKKKIYACEFLKYLRKLTNFLKQRIGIFIGAQVPIVYKKLIPIPMVNKKKIYACEFLKYLRSRGGILKFLNEKIFFLLFKTKIPPLLLKFLRKLTNFLKQRIGIFIGAQVPIVYKKLIPIPMINKKKIYACEFLKYLRELTKKLSILYW